MRMIGISGPKGSGKDTAATILARTNEVEGYDYFRRAPMAEGVKRICNDFFGWPMDQQDLTPFKETPRAGWAATDPAVELEPRWAQMDIANWMRLRWGSDVHVRRWLRHAKEYEDSVSNLVCHYMTDLRFPEEHQMLLDHDALIIYIERSSAELALYEKQAAGDSMALNQSESHYDRIKNHPNTIIIPNNKEPYHLWNEVRAAVKNKFEHPLLWKVA